MKRFLPILLLIGLLLPARAAETLMTIPLRSSALSRGLLTNTTPGAWLATLGVSPTQIYDGSSLTNLNAAQLTAGTIPNGRFPATLPVVSGVNLTSLTAANLTGTLPVLNGGPLTNLFGITLDVKSFGAIGNGTADDTAAITNALNRVASSGTNGWVHIPAGTYKITATLQISSNTRLTLDQGATILRGANTDSMLLNKSAGSLGLWGASSNIIVEGGTWDGNKANFATTATLLAFGHCYNVTVRDTNIRNGPGSWHSIEFNSTKQGRISDCTFSNCSSSETIQLDIAADVAAFPWFGPYDNTECVGIVIDHNMFDNFLTGVGSHRAAAGHMHNNIVIRNNTFTNFTADAICGYNWNAVLLDGNYADKGYRFADTDLDTTAADPGFTRYDWKIVNNRIVNMTVDTAQGRGIKLKWIENVLISGNTISNIARHGIGVDWYGRNITIANNYIFDCGQLAGTGKGIWLFGACDAVVSGNIVSNCFDAGISIGASIAGNTTTNVTVFGNICPKDSIGIDTCSNVMVFGNRCLGAVANAGAATDNFVGVNGAGTNNDYTGSGTMLTNKVATKSADYSVATTDSLVLLTGNHAATLPTAVGIQGKSFTVACSSAGTNAILSTSAQTFLGYGNASAAKWTNSVVGRSTTVVSDGANWVVVKSDN